MDFKFEYIVIYVANIAALVMLVLISEWILRQYKGQNQEIDHEEGLMDN